MLAASLNSDMLRNAATSSAASAMGTQAGSWYASGSSSWATSVSSLQSPGVSPPSLASVTDWLASKLPLLESSKYFLFMAIVIAVSTGFSLRVIGHVLDCTINSPFRQWQRPPRASLIMGNITEMQKDEPGDIQLKWARQYGGAVIYRGILLSERLCLSDPLALSHVLTNAYVFPKPAGTRSALSNILGDGVLTTEGDVHKRQRRLVNPTFNHTSVRGYVGLFHRHARALVARVEELRARNDLVELAPHMKPRYSNIRAANIGPVIDVLNWVSRTTLDVIGEAAFNYDLRSLHPGAQGSDIAISFQKMMTRVADITLFERFQLHIEQFSMFDRIRPLPTSFNRAAQETQKDVEVVAGTMIDNPQRVFTTEEADLLSKLVTINEDPKTPRAHRMSRQELLGQLTTIILAGHETTSTALTWTLKYLAEHPSMQNRLRAEIREAWTDDEDDLSFETLTDLPYLGRVTNEILRLQPPVFSTNREAAHDCVIPLSQPIRMKDGSLVSHFPVRAGQPLIISIVTYNRRKDIWGDDALEFKPDRWLRLPDAVRNNGIPGGHLAFISGPRNCVGSKFALTEFKVILSHLIRAFEFKPLPKDICQFNSKQVVVTRPRVIGVLEEGTQCPLQILPAPAP